MIKFVDLPSLHRPLKQDLDAAIQTVMSHHMFVGGPEVSRFEASFAEMAGAAHCVAVNSGTAALVLGLLALDLPPGAVVATVGNTFVATAEAIFWAGHSIAWVDVEPETGLMDPASLERVLQRQRVDLVMPVHVYGAPAPMTAILGLARRHGAGVAVDACQAHGARVETPRGFSSAGFGSTWAAYSFYPSKNLGAMGDGGAIVTDDSDIARRVRLLRDHGQETKNTFLRPGFTERMDTLQAAFLGAKLTRLEGWNRRRRALAAAYDALLPESLPLRRDRYGRGVCHLYPVRVPQRDRVRQVLADAGVETAIHYRRPAHHMVGGRDQADLPVTDRLCEMELSLPVHPGLTEEDVETVCRELMVAIRS